MAIQPSELVASNIEQLAALGLFFLSQCISRLRHMVPLTIKKSSISMRVTVTSASIPPLLLSHCVYTILPVATSTSLAQIN